MSIIASNVVCKIKVVKLLDVKCVVGIKYNWRVYFLDKCTGF